MSNLIELMKQAALDAVKNMKPANVILATVIQEKPLIVETESKLILEQEFLILARDVTDYQTIISFDDEKIKQRIKIYKEPEDEPFNLPSVPPKELREITDIQFIYTDYKENDNNGNKDLTGKQPTRHTITVYNHLEEGEKIIMIMEQGGQRFFIIDRLGEMDW